MKSQAIVTEIRTFERFSVFLVRETKDTVRVSLQEYLFTGSSKATSCGFWQKRVRLSASWRRGLTVLQEPALTVLLVLPIWFENHDRPFVERKEKRFGLCTICPEVITSI